jgi:signal transduction histidine kinase
MTPEHFKLLSLVAAANIFLGYLVWRRNRSNPVNRYFAMFAVAVAAWTLSNGLVNSYAATPWGVLWARASFASSTVIALSFFLFAGVFPSPSPRTPPALRAICISAGILTTLLSATSLIAKSTSLTDATLKVVYGPLHPVFAVYFIGSLGYGLVSLARKLKVLTGIQKVQVRYVFVGIATAAIGGTTANLLIPLALHSSRFSPYGPLFALLMVALTAHSIIRYRLLNTRLVLRRNARYFVAAASAAILVWLVARTASHIFLSDQLDVPVGSGIVLALFMALVFDPVRHRVHNAIDRYFFREPYTYQHIIREISREMTTMLELQPLIDYLGRVIGKTVRCESVAVYTRVPQGTDYQRIAKWSQTNDNHDQPRLLNTSSPLVVFLSRSRRYIATDELSAEHNDVLTDLLRLSAEFAIPISRDEELTGFLLLGPKSSGDPYFAEDIDLLTTLVSQAAIAIQNAELYSQVMTVEREKRRAERLASVGALASGIAHEIKNPLVAIRAFAELLPERYADEEFREDFSKVATREIERIDELVGRLSGLAAAPVERFAALDLREPINETLALLRGQLQLSRIKIDTNYDARLPLVPGDKSQLKQLFLNLFKNAIEAMHEGGQLSVRAYGKSGVAGQSVVAEITDAGKGIPEDMLGTIFDPFVTTKPHGSGLGLSISRGIADAHRATIYAKNNGMSAGTTIVLEFPTSEKTISAVREF